MFEDKVTVTDLMKEYNFIELPESYTKEIWVTFNGKYAKLKVYQITELEQKLRQLVGYKYGTVMIVEDKDLINRLETIGE